MHTIVHQSDVLAAGAKSGQRKYWTIMLLRDDAGTHYTRTAYWQDLASGGVSAVQESEPALVVCKNIGKRNETTPYEQGMSEIRAAIKRQRDKKGYRGLDEAPDAQQVVLPMFAEKFGESADKLDWSTGVRVQPKYDGHRALFDGERFTTRGGQEHKPHILDTLKFDTRGLTFDGELMLDPHSPPCKGLSKVERFQLSGSAVTKNHPELTPYLCYYVYDVVLDTPFCERHVDLLNVLAPEDRVREGRVVITPTPRVYSEEDIAEWFKTFIAQGYEGAMIRDSSGGYEVGRRSNQLQKLKKFDDDEFVIVDVVPSGKGKAAKVGKFKCLTADGVEFEANPRGAYELRESYLRDREQLIGQQLTVHYEGFTKDGKPRFPRAIAVRAKGE